MNNLLDETITAIEESGHMPADIVFIGSEISGHECTWEVFQVLANREYDDGYGGQEVCSDLIIVFSDGEKMWRSEYDGSEWWSYSTPFVQPADRLPIATLFGKRGWERLAEANTEVTA